MTITREKMRTRDVMVLCYHAVSPRWTADLSIPPAVLDAQIRYLVAHGWQGQTFTEAVLGSSPGKVLAVTFDDAFASVKEYALPILERYEMLATVFAPTAFMDGHVNLAWPGIEHWKHTESANELRAMDWNDLAELARSGWEIGCHTHSHPHLTTVDDDILVGELQEPRRLFSRRLGKPCRSIAYPYGDVDARVLKAAATAGYDTGARLSRDLRPSNSLAFPRVGIYHPDNWSRFRVKIAAAVRQLRARSFA